MVKGTHKQMVVVKTNGSVYYEQAYFVLREARRSERDAESTMMAEANRILHESQLMPQPDRRPRVSRRACFLWGMLAGGLACGGAALVLFLLL